MLGEREDRHLGVGGRQGCHGKLFRGGVAKLSIEGNINNVLE